MVFTIDGRETENASEINGLVAVVTTAEPDSSKMERGGGGWRREKGEASSPADMPRRK